MQNFFLDYSKLLFIEQIWRQEFAVGGMFSLSPLFYLKCQKHDSVKQILRYLVVSLETYIANTMCLDGLMPINVKKHVNEMC